MLGTGVARAGGAQHAGEGCRAVLRTSGERAAASKTSRAASATVAAILPPILTIFTSKFGHHGPDSCFDRQTAKWTFQKTDRVHFTTNNSKSKIFDLLYNKKKILKACFFGILFGM